MPANAVVRARIDAKTKAEAATVLATIGLTVSDAFRLLMIRVAQDKAMPFEPLIPNAETIAAMEESIRGELTRVGTISDLMAQLNADD
jgi:DNA-damage-inducible protein J